MPTTKPGSAKKPAAKATAKPAAKAKAAPAKAAPAKTAKAASTPKTPTKTAAPKAAAPKAPAPAAGPAEGAQAPAFSMPASGGRTVSSEALKGKAYLLYFYPKADTPGCTKQACGVQEALPQLGKIGLEVIGVSPDPMKPIEKFAEKYKLTFPLASDEDQKVATAYGTWVEKSMYGKTYMGMERSSFLVGPDGVVRKVWRKVKPEAHAAEVMEAAKTLLG
jgi:peroxiredoxin Q/BCP